jgi:hypothetical protein
MAQIPRKKRMTGDEPLLGAYSRNNRDERNEPKISAGISGLRYCTIPAL